MVQVKSWKVTLVTAAIAVSLVAVGPTSKPGGPVGAALVGVASAAEPAGTASTQGAAATPGAAATTGAAATGSGTFVGELPSEVPEAPAPPIVRPDSDFLTLAMRAGGTMFWVLLVMGGLGVVIAGERLFTLGQGQVDVGRFMGEVNKALQTKGVHGALEICARNKGPVSKLVQYGLARAGRGADGVDKAVSTSILSQLVDARRGLGVLSFLGQTAPLIGFVSTFMGILNAFNAAIDSNKVMAAQAIGGLSEAVVPTVAGLAVAIVANICINLVSARIDRLSVQLEEAGDELVEALNANQGLKGRTA